jgi:hypothetical protein
MTDIAIQRVHTEMEITESVGALGPAELKKLVALVMEKLKMQQHHQDLHERDNRLQNSAYVPDVTG